MHLDRIFTTCPYLTGSPEGIVCKAVITLIRYIEDVNPGICISRHFELCHVYLSKLHEINITPDLAGNESIGINLTKI